MEVLSVLKRTGGLPVRPLSERMGMSYMGVKQYCLELEKKGFLETWRQPRGVGRGGRPEMLYRLTDRAHSLFPPAQNDLTLELLEAVHKVSGSAAPEKLLFTVFQNRAERYLKNLPKFGSLALRTSLFARLRDQEGCMAEFDGAAKAPAPPRPSAPRPAARQRAPRPSRTRPTRSAIFSRPCCRRPTSRCASSSIVHPSPIWLRAFPSWRGWSAICSSAC